MILNQIKTKDYDLENKVEKKRFEELKASIENHDSNQTQLFDYDPDAFPYLSKHPNGRVIKYGDLRHLDSSIGLSGGLPK